ncbi:unnamed protein product [Dracunculus medinensis]|uniref:Golgin-45 n=1 Tax=Dracunculus medinensis TaxID=318479 RepID=A0A0N4UPA4_DRAME|nr:unnamed protein product [Dracunculus medinensis]
MDISDSTSLVVDEKKDGDIYTSGTMFQNGSDGESQRLKHDLKVKIEKSVTDELKRLLVASVGDDLSCHLHSLSEDKVRLASAVDHYASKLKNDHDRAEALEISSDMWRCKFFAMSIRADELLSQRNHLLQHIRDAHSTISQLLDLLNSTTHLSQNSENMISQAKHILSEDITHFFERSPCDEKPRLPKILASNITVACCKNCVHNEIKLFTY